MFDPEAELIRFLREHGVGAWVRDGLGRVVRVEDWAEEFFEQAREYFGEDEAEEADRARAIRDLLDEKPRKMVSVVKLREILD